MSKQAENIERARRAYKAAIGTPNEQLMRGALERAVAAVKQEASRGN